MIVGKEKQTAGQVQATTTKIETIASLLLVVVVVVMVAADFVLGNIYITNNYKSTV